MGRPKCRRNSRKIRGVRNRSRIDLDAGRVCIAGWFGRAWIGIVTFNGETNKSAVKVIHEAKEVPRQGEKEPWLNPKLTFVPEYVRVLRGKPGADGKASVRALIGRGWAVSQTRTQDYLPQMGPHPLIFDPESGIVETVKTPVPVAGWQIGTHGDTADGSILVSYPRGGGGLTSNLFRIDYPGTARDLGALEIPNATTSMH